MSGITAWHAMVGKKNADGHMGTRFVHRTGGEEDKKRTHCVPSWQGSRPASPLDGMVWHGMAWDEGGGRGPDAGAVVRLWIPGFRTVGCWLLLLLDRCCVSYVRILTQRLGPATIPGSLSAPEPRVVLVLPIVGLCFVLFMVSLALPCLALPCPSICA